MEMEDLMNELEQNIDCIGGTAVKDKLQYKVPDCIGSL